MIDIGDKVKVVDKGFPGPPNEWIGMEGTVTRDYGDGVVMVETLMRLGTSRIMAEKQWLENMDREKDSD